MAVLGTQLVVTLVMVSIIQKFNKHFSFGKWILCSTGLSRYLHPTDEELRLKAGIPKDRGSKGGGGGGKGRHDRNGGHFPAPDQFQLPRSIQVELDKVPVMANDVVHLRFFDEYQWLVDFSVYAVIVYVFSEIFHYYVPLKNEVNLSLVWCLLVMFFAIKFLTSLTVLYFQSDESIGERSMVILAGFVYMLIAMIILIIDESILETGLEEAYANFNDSASKFLSEQGLPSSGPISKIVIKFFIAVGCGLSGSLFTFPGLRMAKMHLDSLRYYQGRRFMQVLLNISFVLPFLIVVLWIRPISRDYLTVRVFQGMDKPILEPHMFDSLRLVIVVVAVMLRFALMPTYLQSYLNLAYDKVVDLRKEAGRITNIEFQKKISSIFYYLCVVTLQFVAPLIFCLYLTLLYKSLSGFSWIGHDAVAAAEAASGVPADECSADLDGSGGGSQFITASMDEHQEQQQEQFDMVSSAQSMQSALTSLSNVFSPAVYKGFLGFATWWSYFLLCITSTLGMVYQTYFSKI